MLKKCVNWCKIAKLIKFLIKTHFLFWNIQIIALLECLRNLLGSCQLINKLIWKFWKSSVLISLPISNNRILTIWVTTWEKQCYTLRNDIQLYYCIQMIVKCMKKKRLHFLKKDIKSEHFGQILEIGKKTVTWWLKLHGEFLVTVK